MAAYRLGILDGTVLHVFCIKNKLHSYHTTDLCLSDSLLFAYAKNQFSHDVAALAI